MGWSLPLGVWSRRKRILVVEDSPTMAAIIANILQAFNYDIVTVSTGHEAMEQVQAQRPDLVLLDVLLPDTNGSIICQRLKADPSTWDIPVIYLTSKAETTIESGRTIHSADGYLAKPVRQWELVNRVEHFLRRQV